MYLFLIPNLVLLSHHESYALIKCILIKLIPEWVKHHYHQISQLNNCQGLYNSFLLINKKIGCSFPKKRHHLTKIALWTSRDFESKIPTIFLSQIATSGVVQSVLLGVEESPTRVVTGLVLPEGLHLDTKAEVWGSGNSNFCGFRYYIHNSSHS